MWHCGQNGATARSAGVLPTGFEAEEVVMIMVVDPENVPEGLRRCRERERDDALMKSADAMHCAFQAIADWNSTMAVFG